MVKRLLDHWQASPQGVILCSSQQDIPGKCSHKMTACVLGHRQPCLKLEQWTCRTLDGSMSTAGHHHDVSMEVSTQVTAASEHQPGRKTRAHMSCLLLLFKLQAHMPAGAMSHHASEICRALRFLNALQEDKAPGQSSLAGIEARLALLYSTHLQGRKAAGACWGRRF